MTNSTTSNTPANGGQILTDEPLPCPFCGGEAAVGPTRTSYIVECNNASCGVNPDALATFKHGAVDAWNRRAAPAPVSGMPDLAKRIKDLRAPSSLIRCSDSYIEGFAKARAMAADLAALPSPQAPDTPNPTGETE